MSCKLTPAQFVQAVSLTASLIKLISASKETIIAHRSVAIEMDIFNVPLDENDSVKEAIHRMALGLAGLTRYELGPLVPISHGMAVSDMSGSIENDVMIQNFFAGKMVEINAICSGNDRPAFSGSAHLNNSPECYGCVVAMFDENNQCVFSAKGEVMRLIGQPEIIACGLTESQTRMNAFSDFVNEYVKRGQMAGLAGLVDLGQTEPMKNRSEIEIEPARQKTAQDMSHLWGMF